MISIQGDGHHGEEISCIDYRKLQYINDEYGTNLYVQFTHLYPGPTLGTFLEFGLLQCHLYW